MRGSLLKRAYRRFGSRYLPRVLFIQQQSLYVLIVPAVAGAPAYLEMSFGEFVRLAVAGCALQFVYSLLSLRVARRLNQPVAAWHEGAGDKEATVEAWRSAASFPWEIVRQGLFSVRLGLPLWTFYFVWSAYLVWELGLPAYSVLLVYLGVAVLVLYAVTLRFFGVERIVRPVLEDIGAALPDRVAPHAPGLSVRARLLVALPAINVVIAVVANGAASGGDADLADLAVVVLIAAAVAGTISLVLTVLLARSISEPITELREATKLSRRGRLRGAGAGGDDRRDRRPRALIQRDGGRARGARADPRDVWDLCRPRGSRAHPARGHLTGGRAGRGHDHVPRRPRLHGLRRARLSARGRLHTQPPLRSRRPRDP